MEYFKTLGGALERTLEGEKDDNGNTIKSTEKPMTKEQYLRHKEQKIKNKISTAVKGSKNS